MKRIKLDFNTALYQDELTKMRLLGNTMGTVRKYILEITKDEIDIFDMEAIENWIRNHYGFANVSQLMSLNNLEIKYQFIKNFLANNDVELLKEFNLNNKGSYEPSKVLLSALDDKYSTFVQDDFVSKYKALKSAENALDNCDSRLLNAMLVKTTEGLKIDFKRFAALQGAYTRNLI